MFLEQVIRLSEELSKGESGEDQSPEYQVLECPVIDNNKKIISPDDRQRSSSVDAPGSPTSLELPASPMSTTGDNLLEECENGISDETQALTNKEGNDESENVDESKRDNSETAIKRTSSGKSPSKIPRYVGENGKQGQQENSGKISYYMSLKRGKESDGNEAKFYIQVHDLENASPYMQLVRQESNTTINSERDSCISDIYASPFQTNRNSEVFPEESKRSILNSVSSLCSNDPSALDVNSLYEALVRPIQAKWKSPKSIDKSNDRPQSPPPPLPPRYLDNIEDTTPSPPSPKNAVSPKDVVRTEGQFTSYLPSETTFNYDADSTAPSLPSWVLSDSVTSLGK